MNIGKALFYILTRFAAKSRLFRGGQNSILQKLVFLKGESFCRSISQPFFCAHPVRGLLEIKLYLTNKTRQSWYSLYTYIYCSCVIKSISGIPWHASILLIVKKLAKPFSEQYWPCKQKQIFVCRVGWVDVEQVKKEAHHGT